MNLVDNLQKSKRPRCNFLGLIWNKNHHRSDCIDKYHNNKLDYGLHNANAFRLNEGI